MFIPDSRVSYKYVNQFLLNLLHYNLAEIKKYIGENNFNGYTNTVVVGKIAKISAPSSRISEYFSYQLSFKEVQHSLPFKED